jgi:WD40 repeat protein
VSGGGWGDASVIVWDLETAQQLHRFLVPADPSRGLDAVLYVDSVAVNSSGSMVLSGTSDGILRVYDLSQNLELQGPETICGHQDRITAIDLSSDLKTIATTSADCTVRLWDLESKTCRGTITARE